MLTQTIMDLNNLMNSNANLLDQPLNFKKEPCIQQNQFVIPPEFDENIYKNIHIDLMNMDNQTLQQHYLKYGKSEGRRANNLLGRTNFIELIPLNRKVLEIGPFCNPLTKSHQNVKYFDILSRDDLIKKAKQMDLNPDNIPSHIDFFSTSTDLSVISEQFEFIISSHVIEHQLDLLQHFKEIYRLLSPGGYYFILIPDKRYCFDHFIPESNFATIFEAHYAKKIAHPLSSIIEHRALTTHNDAMLHWQGSHGNQFENLSRRIQSAIEEYELSAGNYIDVHRWYFTPDSFRQLLLAFKQIEIEFLSLEEIYPTRYGANEFWVILKKHS